jgi:hypothetical protein
LEYDIVKKHTTFGAQILENCNFESMSPDIKKYAVDIARYHHERYDGTGYPEGLQGEEIPLCAQVVALADAYDALTSFGMPTLRLGFGDRLSNMLPSYCGEKSLDRITCYERLFEEAQSLDHELSSDDETSQVLDELLDDIWLYLRLNTQELQPDEVLAMWDVPVGLDAMLGMDVERASRIQMMGLLGAMMRLPNPKSAMEAAVVDGSFARWIERLRQIPRDEEAEREKKLRINRQTLEVADSVVEKQMRIVQEIASLLGETAAETKIALTKLKESVADE